MKSPFPFSMDTTPLAFGKHRGSTPEQVASSEPSYIEWLYEHIKPRVVSKQLYLACANIRNDREETLNEDDFHGDQ